MENTLLTEIMVLREKNTELVEMLKSFVNDFDNGLIDDFQIPRDRFESLINSNITE